MDCNVLSEAAIDAGEGGSAGGEGDCAGGEGGSAGGVAVGMLSAEGARLLESTERAAFKPHGSTSMSRTLGSGDTDGVSDTTCGARRRRVFTIETLGEQRRETTEKIEEDVIDDVGEMEKRCSVARTCTHLPIRGGHVHLPRESWDFS